MVILLCLVLSPDLFFKVIGHISDQNAEFTFSTRCLVSNDCFSRFSKTCAFSFAVECNWTYVLQLSLSVVMCCVRPCKIASRQSSYQSFYLVEEGKLLIDLKRSCHESYPGLWLQNSSLCSCKLSFSWRFVSHWVHASRSLCYDVQVAFSLWHLNGEVQFCKTKQLHQWLDRFILFIWLWRASVLLREHWQLCLLYYVHFHLVDFKNYLFLFHLISPVAHVGNLVTCWIYSVITVSFPLKYILFLPCDVPCYFLKITKYIYTFMLCYCVLDCI